MKAIDLVGLGVAAFIVAICLSRLGFVLSSESCWTTC